MLTSYYASKAFKIRSIEPELIVQYVHPLWQRVAFLLMLSPFIALFLAHCAIFLFAIKALLTLDLRQLVYTLSYSTGNPLHVLTFAFTFPLLGVICWYGPDSALTATELRATNEEILLTYKTPWRFYEVSIPSNSIAYFHQYLNRDGVNGNSWILEAVTNQRLSREINSLPVWIPTKWTPEALAIRLNYRVVNLFSNSSEMPVEWLGSALADFYGVEQRSQLKPF